jgi:hypothetical protein
VRYIAVTGKGEVELRYMWLPTFIGMDPHLSRKIEEKVSPMLIGKEATDTLLEEAHEAVIDLICEHHKIPGLRDFLDALKFVEG